VADTPSTAPASPAADGAAAIEKPACFYLGREYDLASKTVVKDGYVMYDARDLTTHGVVVGMTGSGKTGLCISILEEAAIDGIPSVIIDPKGDLTNLLLQFPALEPADFEKWMNTEGLDYEDNRKLSAKDAARKKREIAEQLAKRWREGIAEDGAQTVERIGYPKKAADYRIYTPGSEAGLSLSILGKFSAPREKLPREALAAKINATATALLGLTGIVSDPIQSREHVLVANLLDHAWKNNREYTLRDLVNDIARPPIREVGAYNLETFFPSKERVKFAATLNNVLAAPGFATWMTGEPLDLGSMLYRSGKPQHLIFYIAHLDDTQRMFFVTLLLEELLTWVRRQSGTTNLRALLYFDEVFGYMPPHPANPPSKQPLLTLLKQARAFGVGVLLATQNPVDLDYKALSNAGTWFVGKLQTERDKNRLLEGLETVAAETGTLTDRSYLETVISSLSNRIFLLHDIHRPKPILFQSRWALSFLRGPLTREQVGELMQPLKEQPPLAIPLCNVCGAELGPETVDKCPKCGKDPYANASFRVLDREFRDGLLARGTLAGGGSLPTVAPAGEAAVYQPPVLSSDVTQFYLAPGRPVPEGADLEYVPKVLGFAEVTFPVDKRKGIEHREFLFLLAEPEAPGHPVEWDNAERTDGKLDAKAIARIRWANVPESLDTGKKLKALEKGFVEYLYATRKLSLFENRSLELISAPGESEAAFRKRCKEAAEVEAQQAVEMERVKFRPKFEALDSELPDEPPPPPPPPKPSGGWFTGWFGGGESASPVRRKPALSPKQEEKVRKLAADYQAKKNEIQEKWKRAGEEVAPLQVKPRKTDVRVTHFGIGWVPCLRESAGGKVRLKPLIG
jgi:hypothetical protein